MRRPEGLDDQSESVVAMLRNAHLNGLAALVRGQVFARFLRRFFGLFDPLAGPFFEHFEQAAEGFFGLFSSVQQ